MYTHQHTSTHCPKSSETIGNDDSDSRPANGVRFSIQFFCHTMPWIIKLTPKIHNTYCFIIFILRLQNLFFQYSYIIFSLFVVVVGGVGVLVVWRWISLSHVFLYVQLMPRHCKAFTLPCKCRTHKFTHAHAKLKQHVHKLPSKSKGNDKHTHTYT